MKFNELPDDKKIFHVKEKFAEIIGEVVAKKSELDKYVPIPEAGNTAESKAAVEAAKTKRAAALDKISKLKEREDCICEPRELNIDVDDIAEEFDIFIDSARSRAEEGIY